MRTGCSLTICRSLLLRGGLDLIPLNFPPPNFPLGCGPGSEGHTPRADTSLWEQTPPWSRHPPGADTPPGSRHPPEQTPPWNVKCKIFSCCKACWDTTCNACWDSTPPVYRITDTSKNITLAPTSLRPVKIVHRWYQNTWKRLY